ncbi:MAG TPA: SDR family NAD(P)-dependent oxidoreductase [Stellaceae bacterium]|nr:SDR family NAD(P)-dependent oxidoreductase [Stellaceae bacterium]
MAPIENTARGVCLVTGASSGIGAAIVEKLVADGWRVVAAARRVERLAALSARLGARCHPIALDVTDRDSVSTLIGRLPQEWRAICVLVNNAGHDIGGRTPFDHQAVDDMLSTIETNVAGMIRVTREIVPIMLARNEGHIVNIGSNASTVAYAGGTAYVASKFAVNGFSKALRLDYLGKIRVTQILPGLVRTEFAEVRNSGDKAKADAFYASYAGCLRPEDVAHCVAFALGQPPHVNIAELLVLPSR